MRAESKIAQVTGRKRACKCTLCRYPRYPTDFFSRVNAQDAREEETNRQRNEESNLPFSGRTDVPRHVPSHQGPLQSGHGILSAVVCVLPKTDLIIDPRRWRGPGDRL
jgi:hypothetical protein